MMEKEEKTLEDDIREAPEIFENEEEIQQVMEELLMKKEMLQIE